MPFDGLQHLRMHLAALQGLLERMEPDHVGRPNLVDRIAECEAAIDAERAARKTKTTQESHQ